MPFSEFVHDDGQPTAARDAFVVGVLIVRHNHNNMHSIQRETPEVGKDLPHGGEELGRGSIRRDVQHLLTIRHVMLLQTSQQILSTIELPPWTEREYCDWNNLPELWFRCIHSTRAAGSSSGSAHLGSTTATGALPFCGFCGHAPQARHDLVPAMACNS